MSLAWDRAIAKPGIPFRRAVVGYMASESTFETVVRQAEAVIPRAQYHIGGNAALMAERIASGFPSTEVYLVGPIGPRSQALLNPSVRRTNSTRITKVLANIMS
ncbi:hypothetical protein ANCCEY_01883 [Ancylostoma ceylanicum]|uniref:Uncharacterized protein n=1 Tax=Ancylostoma ceylanicum TaxID=53326 RepID=A0A0D6M9B3_9BILA|nr:hypothetical protein ANCCEY_01883 [Ancylostoma ceylanicum]